MLDPFAGTGSTAQAAIGAGRNSISLDIEPTYVDIARKNIEKVKREKRVVGALHADLITERHVGKRSAKRSA